MKEESIETKRGKYETEDKGDIGFRFGSPVPVAIRKTNLFHLGSFSLLPCSDRTQSNAYRVHVTFSFELEDQ